MPATRTHPDRSAVEELVSTAWCRSLDVEHVGLDERLGELLARSPDPGAVRETLRLALEADFGTPVPRDDVHAESTVASLAAVVEDAVGRPGTTGFVRLQRGDGSLPFFSVCSIAGTVFNHLELARALGSAQTFHGLQALDLRERLGREPGLVDYAASYVEGILERAPHGDVVVGGHSFGAVVAYEVARQLAEVGRPPALLYLIDTAPPNQDRATAWERTQGLLQFTRGLAYLPGEFLDRGRKDAGLLAREVKKRLAWKAKVVGRRALNLVDPKNSASRPTRQQDASLTPDEFLEMAHWPERHRAIARAHYRAIQGYRTPSYPGRATLFRVQRHKLSYPRSGAYGWEKYVQGGLEVVRLPGGHMRLLETPNVEVLARHLRQRVEALGGSGPD